MFLKAFRAKTMSKRQQTWTVKEGNLSLTAKLLSHYFSVTALQQLVLKPLMQTGP